MKTQIHHAALNVSEFDWYQNFFQDVFGMTVRKIAGEPTARKLWFHEGIQLNEHPSASSISNNVYDHISLAVENIPETVQTAIEAGCSALPNGSHWFALPNGVRIELMQL